MIAGILQSIRRERRGATALIIALMTTPLIIASGAAVDFSRISSARAQLQSAVDAAALAGVGAYQINKDGVVAYNVSNTAFNTATSNLNSYAAISSTVGTLCNTAGTATCGTTHSPNGATALCPSTTVYCVEINATATLQNSLLAIVIPRDVLNVTSVAQSTGINQVNNGNISHAGNGYGSDAVIDTLTPTPQDSGGNPIYGNPSAPNTNCNSSTYGILRYLPETSPANGQTGCNYVIIGTNSGSNGSSSFGFSPNDPLDFTLEDFSGGNITTGTSDLDTTLYNIPTGTSSNPGVPDPYFYELYVTTTTITALGVPGTYYLQYGGSLGGIGLYGYCPAHNLYGSIIAYPNATTDIVPYQDSINVFSSSWEKLGYPPTHGTNHALLPFLGPANSAIPGLSGVTVHAVCPQWPIPYFATAATASFSPSNLPAGYTPVTNTPGNFPTETVAVYSTYYPDQQYPGPGSNNNYPPVISGCTPATSSTSATGISDNGEIAFSPWWGWSPANNIQPDPGGAGENPGGGAVTNCTSTVVTSSAGVTTTQNVLQSPLYNDCAFIIQPLGTSVPANGSGIPDLPDYYTYSVVPNGLTMGLTGNASSIVSSQTPPLTGMTPVYDGIGNTHPAGYVPTAVSITGSGSVAAPYVVTEPPAYGADDYPPEDTSHQCYNPKANGIDGTTLPASDQPNNDSSPATPIDPVQNPEFGAVLCNYTPAQSYAVYWNDMGSYSQPPRFNDDLGYANAFTEFTCPTPGSPGATGPPALID